jgi:hypothetical protein
MTKSLMSVVFTLLVFALASAVFAGSLSTLQKPSLLSPSNYTVFENVPQTTTLAWSPIADAVSYTVTLEYSSTGVKGSFTPVAGSPFPATDTAYVFNATDDGHYEWYVTAVGDGVNSNPSTARYFSFLATAPVNMAAPNQISPSNGAQFYNTNPRQAILAWAPNPAAAGGYSVYIESYDPGTRKWAAVSGSPFSVPASPTWQNSSYTFPAAAAGEFRWAVQAIGDGETTVDSPEPTDSKAKEWWRFSFED